MNLSNRKGVALIFSLYLVIVLLAISSLFILKTVHEANMARVERELAKSFYIAEGGCHVGLDDLNVMINTDLLNTVSATTPRIVADIADNENVLDFLEQFTKKDGQKEFAFTDKDETALIHQGTLTQLGNLSYQYAIVVTAKSGPDVIKAGEEWDLPYFYRIETTGSAKGASKDVVLSGDFTVHVKKDNFAKYALFTDHHTLPDGKTNVWFTKNTNFAGPVYTNHEFSFAGNPSGTFEGAVTQHEQKARFFNGKAPGILLNEDANGTIDVPVFNAGFTRGVDTIVLESSIQKEDLAKQATGEQQLNGNGIFIPNDGQNLVGGIFVRGNSTIAMSVDGSKAKYTIQEEAVTKVISVDKENKKTTVSESGKSDLVYNGLPDGIDDEGTIVYVEGTVNSLKGTVQKDQEVTVSSEKDIIITGHIRYENFTPAIGKPGDAGYVPPNADDQTNLLGILSWGGNVSIATSAPKDINIHGTVLARNGIFTVTNYYDQGVGPRGTATLLGGAITQFYGAFGTFNADGLKSGYGRNFVYDGRMLQGKSPPYFPTLKTYTSFSNDITDKIVWQEG